MTAWLRGLAAGQQVGALFVLTFGVLALITAGSLRRGAPPALVRASWVMAAVFWLGWLAGAAVSTTLFGLLSFFALREYITLSPTRRADHRTLALAFYGVLPAQYWLVATQRFDLFTVFIPVYVFLALPAASALADDAERFLERTAKVQWGVMVCVYGLSHVPALMLLDFAPRAGYAGRSAFLVFFLVFVVQAGRLVEHVAGHRRTGTWWPWAAGLASAMALGAVLAFITPFAPGQAAALAGIAAAAGSLGHRVMRALKRDRGVAHWGQAGGGYLGAGGLLDRIDALCFAAPIFFHSVRWYFGL